MFCAKKYESTVGIIIAICDYDLVGKKLKYGDATFTVKREFYCSGKIFSEEEIIPLMMEATSLNLLGNKIVELAKRLGLVHSNAIIYFDSDEGPIAYVIIQVMRF